MLQQDISSFAEHHTVQTRLDDFYMSRIGIRMVRTYAHIARHMHRYNNFFETVYYDSSFYYRVPLFTVSHFISISLIYCN